MSSGETILLARHGETDDNIPPIRIQGFRDTPLNETGRRQAHELAERLEAEPIASLWSSDLGRARETAEILGARLGLEPRLGSTDPLQSFRSVSGSFAVWLERADHCGKSSPVRMTGSAA